MVLRSGKTYPPDHLDKKVKLGLIFKKLQDLKLSVDGLESKSNERTLENRNDRRRDDIISRARINEDDIICRIKIDSPTFNDILNPKIFSDWMKNLDYYFDWYRFTKKSRVWFARMKLTGSARIYWTSVDIVHEAWGFHKVLGENKTET